MILQLSGSMNGSPEQPDGNLILPGLTLHGATWNTRNCCLELMPNKKETSSTSAAYRIQEHTTAVVSFVADCVKDQEEAESVMPSLVEEDEDASQIYYYNCPVFMKTVHTTPLLHIPLPSSAEILNTSAAPPIVYLSCGQQIANLSS